MHTQKQPYMDPTQFINDLANKQDSMSDKINIFRFLSEVAWSRINEIKRIYSPKMKKFLNDALAIACLSKSTLNVFEFLLSKGADPNYEIGLTGGYTQPTPVMHALYTNDTQLADLFLRFCDINRITCGTTLLNYVVNKNKPNMVDFLLERGANINKKSGYGFSALHTAVYNNNIDIIRLLLNRGINIKLKDNYGQTAYDLAIHIGRTNIAEMIKNHEEKIYSKALSRRITGGSNVDMFSKYLFSNKRRHKRHYKTQLKKRSKRTV